MTYCAIASLTDFDAECCTTVALTGVSYAKQGIADAEFHEGRDWEAQAAEDRTGRHLRREGAWLGGMRYTSRDEDLLSHSTYRASGGAYSLRWLAGIDRGNGTQGMFSGDAMLDIEVDGERYHRSWDGEICRRDQIRNQRLYELGWDVMRFWVYQIRDDLDVCVSRVKRWSER